MAIVAVRSGWRALLASTALVSMVAGIGSDPAQAQSAAQASSEVKGLIEQSGTEVTGGSRLVAEAAQKLVQMLEAARESSALIEGIATASRDQASAIEEVTSAVRALDEMTQHNAALVEETNAAVEQTEAQANELDRIVEVFALDDEPPQRRRAA